MLLRCRVESLRHRSCTLGSVRGKVVVAVGMARRCERRDRRGALVALLCMQARAMSRTASRSAFEWPWRSARSGHVMRQWRATASDG